MLLPLKKNVPLIQLKSYKLDKLEKNVFYVEEIKDYLLH